MVVGGGRPRVLDACVLLLLLLLLVLGSHLEANIVLWRFQAYRPSNTTLPIGQAPQPPRPPHIRKGPWLNSPRSPLALLCLLLLAVGCWLAVVAVAAVAVVAVVPVVAFSLVLLLFLLLLLLLLLLAVLLALGLWNGSRRISACWRWDWCGAGGGRGAPLNTTKCRPH